MELSIKNIGKIETADIEIKGVTVITGYNSTGKSSVCKALYGIMESYSNMNRKVFVQRRSSMASAVWGWQKQISETTNVDDEALDEFADDIMDLIYELDEFNDHCISVERLVELQEENELDIPAEDLQKLIEKFEEIINRDKDEYVRFIVAQKMRNVFSDQIGHVNLNKLSQIQLLENNRSYSVVFEGNTLVESSYTNTLFQKPIYIEPESVLDNCENMGKRLQAGRREEPIRSFLLADEMTGERLTLEQYQERESNIKIIREILESVTNGHLVKNQETKLSYAEKGLKSSIACSNIASGLKPFLLLQRMVENGSLEAGRLLIIDEPEVNLHPAWQLKFAKVLVLLNTELKIQVVISTHSPYFLKAVDFYMEEQENAENGRYYLTKETSNDLYTLVDVTNNKELIYKTMYEPLEEID